MVARPEHWRKYYHGDASALRIQRHFSYSDRVRYYWPDPAAVSAVQRLGDRLAGRRIPETLIGQYLGALYPEVAAGRISSDPNALLLASVRSVLRTYRDAGRG
jgi:D-tagatose-1,6-bisphosphate aldolase subunit GatZ/KbaZ